MLGIFNLNKPSGCSSRDAVDVVARLCRGDKVGHAGTLDPLASGVLVVCVGRATRLIDMVQQMRKSYRAVFLLGRESDTNDIEAEIRLVADAPIPAHADVATAAAKFVGVIEQVPPAFSAVKVGGRRAYALARRGQQVDLAPRPVEIARIAVVRYAYPELELDIDCGSGTYIRALGRDLAKALGTSAVMSALVRTGVGSFRIEHSVDPWLLTPQTLSQHLRSPWEAVAALPRMTLSPEQQERVARGMAIDCPPMLAGQREVAAATAEGDLAAILVPRGAGALGPRLNFLA